MINLIWNEKNINGNDQYSKVEKVAQRLDCRSNDKNNNVVFLVWLLLKRVM